MNIKELKEKADKEAKENAQKALEDCRNAIVYNIKNKMKTNMFKKKVVKFYTKSYCDLKDLANPELLKEPLDIKLVDEYLFKADRIFLLSLDNNYYKLEEKPVFQEMNHITITEIDEETAKKLLIDN